MIEYLTKEQAQAFYRSPEWRKLRDHIYRVRGRHCEYCGAMNLKPRNIALNHVKPLRTHPEHALDAGNLKIACATCHATVCRKDDENPLRGIDERGLPFDPQNPWYHYFD